jgi:hypothetical protein
LDFYQLFISHQNTSGQLALPSRIHPPILNASASPIAALFIQTTEITMDRASSRWRGGLQKSANLTCVRKSYAMQGLQKERFVSQLLTAKTIRRRGRPLAAVPPIGHGETAGPDFRLVLETYFPHSSSRGAQGPCHLDHCGRREREVALRVQNGCHCALDV